MSDRCAELSEAAGESLAASATTATSWLVLEVPGTWPRDVSVEGVLPAAAHEAVSAWLGDTPHSRLQFVRRPGRGRRPPLAFVVRADEAVGHVRRIELEAYDDLARIDLGRYRGRTCYEPRVQAAELAVRQEAVLDGVADLRLVEAGEEAVGFRAWDGSEYFVGVEEARSSPVPASCGADPEPQRAFVARLL